MRIINSTPVFHGRVIDVRQDEVEVNGRTSKVDIVEHRGAVVVIVEPAPGQIVLVRQYRYPIKRAMWEVPAGSIEPDESPEAAAIRELREETGYRAERVTFLWSAYSAPGFCSELLHFYHATGLVGGEAEHDEGEEDMEQRSFRVDEAWAMVERNELPDAKTQIALAWARSR